jgi:xylulokinase
MIFGLDLTHTRADLFRAVLEGVAHGTRHVFDTYTAAGLAPQRIYAVGGGTRNKLWSQATSDICGLPQIVRQRTIGASYGDAFLAAVALGDAKPADIEKWNPVEREIAPRPDLKSLYDERHTVFRGLYPATKAWIR